MTYCSQTFEPALHQLFDFGVRYEIVPMWCELFSFIVACSRISLSLDILISRLQHLDQLLLFQDKGLCISHVFTCSSFDTSIWFLSMKLIISYNRFLHNVTLFNLSGIASILKSLQWSSSKAFLAYWNVPSSNSYTMRNTHSLTVKLSCLILFY